MNYPKSSRIRKREEYLLFFNKSEVIRLKGCTVFRIKNQIGKPRLGITVKAKVNSVYRNKLKRQFKEAFRLKNFSIEPYDYNIVVPGSLKVNFKSPKMIRQVLEHFWSHDSTT